MSERSWYVTLAGSMLPYEWERYRRLTRGLYQAKEGGMSKDDTCTCPACANWDGAPGVRLPNCNIPESTA